LLYKAPLKVISLKGDVALKKKLIMPLFSGLFAAAMLTACGNDELESDLENAPDMENNFSEGEGNNGIK
jgi:hypothetical protein